MAPWGLVNGEIITRDAQYGGQFVPLIQEHDCRFAFSMCRFRTGWLIVCKLLEMDSPDDVFNPARPSLRSIEFILKHASR